MSVRTVAAKFVDLCRQGRNLDVMRTMYVPETVSVEGGVTTREAFVYDGPF
ncbi:MAG TPA: hypothetical protein VF796_26250 [Humisphaera sp.]